jgi:hypothetical protein
MQRLIKRGLSSQAASPRGHGSHTKSHPIAGRARLPQGRLPQARRPQVRLPLSSGLIFYEGSASPDLEGMMRRQDHQGLPHGQPQARLNPLGQGKAFGRQHDDGRAMFKPSELLTLVEGG